MVRRQELFQDAADLGGPGPIILFVEVFDLGGDRVVVFGHDEVWDDPKVHIVGDDES
jgi:hypothetical protein